jgi:hypothetical protein
MPQVYVRNSGVWTESKEIFIRANGGWNTVQEIYVNSNGNWLQTYPVHGSQFLNSGSGTFTVPAGIYSLTVSYPTSRDGIVTQGLSVTPGDTFAYNIADFGSASTFGGITAPVFDTQVYSRSGNVDAVLVITTSCAGAQSFQINAESSHGTLGKNLSLTPVLLEVCQGDLQVYNSYYSGRGTISGGGTPYLSGDSYYFQVSIGDPQNSEGYHVDRWNLRQRVPFTVLW